jgi:hypothetical protein
LPIGWRLLEIAKIEALTVLDDTFKGSRGQSHSDHNEWKVVYARVTSFLVILGSTFQLS